MKKCIKCEGTDKKFFKADKHADGLSSICTDCSIENTRSWRRTKNGLASNIFSSQKASSKLRNHPAPTYSKKELREWLFSKTKFHVLFNNWKNSGFLKSMSPSVDRIDVCKSYSFENIQLMTWHENIMREARRHRKRVTQYSLDGKAIRTYDSVNSAAIGVNGTTQNISACARGELKTSSGFMWEYDIC